MALTAIVTNAGRAALVNAANTGTAPVTIAQVGLTATAVVPGAGITALPDEYKRVATISGDVVADDTIHLIVRDESADVFTVRSFALYLADGTLFAIYGQAGVILEKSAQAMMLLAIDVQFADVAAAMLTFGDTNFLNPPATTSVQGVVELATDEESTTGVDTVRAVTPKGMKTAVTSWLNVRFGDGAPSEFVKGLLTSASAAVMRISLGLKSAALKDEGANNGLDADLLDGQHGSYYSNIPSRLGYVPWGPSNDGAGSGLDADLLDGQDSSYYANIPGRLGYTPANRAGDTFTGNIAVPNLFTGQVLLPASGANQAVVYLHETGGLTFSWNRQVAGAEKFLSLWASGNVTYNGSPLWHAGNDGAGSGLDADLLDGQDGGYYTNIPGRLGYTPVNKAGDTMSGALAVSDGAGMSRLWPNGDSTLYRSGGGTGCLYLNSTNTRYLFNNGSAYELAGQQLYVNGSVSWNAGNDGAGSGLDADLLDGQDGSYYTNIPGRLGYTPANKGGESFLGSISVAAGSAISVNSNVSYGGIVLASGDATHTGSVQFYQPNGTRLGYMGYATPGLHMNYVCENNAGHSFLGGMLYRGGALIWDAANDGAGSGLDADLLDGYQGSDYDRVVAQHLVEDGGYIVYASGRKECWGIANIVTEDAYVTVNLPVAHDSWVNPIGAGVALSATAQDNTAVRDVQFDGNGRPISFRIWNAAGTGGGFPFRWRSIGK